MLNNDFFYFVLVLVQHFSGCHALFDSKSGVGWIFLDPGPGGLDFLGLVEFQTLAGARPMPPQDVNSGTASKGPFIICWRGAEILVYNHAQNFPPTDDAKGTVYCGKNFQSFNILLRNA